MDREEAMDILETAVEEIGMMRTQLEWTEAEEGELIRLQQRLETFVSDASETYEDEL